MIYLPVEFVIELHDNIIQAFGGRLGIREISLLESAVANPTTAVFGQEMYPSIYDKAAAYLFFICKNHPFIDGNKRTATASALIFLRVNGSNIRLTADIDDYVLEIAEGKHKILEISRFLENQYNSPK